MTEIHQSVRRLYAAAKKLSECHNPSPATIGRLLNESTQTVKNWESRGVSKQGALKAQEIIGCDAVWIQEGPDDEVVSVRGGVGLFAAERLPPPYIHPNETTRRIIAMLDETDEAGRGAALLAVMQALKEYRSTKNAA